MTDDGAFASLSFCSQVRFSSHSVDLQVISCVYIYINSASVLVIVVDSSIHWHTGRTAMQSKRRVSLYFLSCLIFRLNIFFYIYLKSSDLLPGVVAFCHNMKWVCTLYTCKPMLQLDSELVFIFMFYGETSLFWADCKILWLQCSRYDLGMEIYTESVTLRNDSDLSLMSLFFLNLISKVGTRMGDISRERPFFPVMVLKEKNKTANAYFKFF